MDAWFAANVRSRDAATGRYEVLYDDDNETEFMFLAPVDAEGVARARGAPCRLMDATRPVEDVARDVDEGARVEVYWNREDRWYAILKYCRAEPLPVSLGTSNLSFSFITQPELSGVFAGSYNTHP